MIRLFAAISVPFEIAEDLASRQRGLPGARWSPAENLHVTLRFFGEMPETAAADLDAELAAVTAKAFDLALQGVGAFGDGDQVRAVWAGTAENEALKRLAGRCETAARRCGLSPEARAYRPHLTLAYLKRSPAERVAAWIQDHNLLHTRAWPVRSFGLYSSWRNEAGSRYELERAYRLG